MILLQWLTCLAAVKMTCCAMGLAEALSVALAVFEKHTLYITHCQITYYFYDADFFFMAGIKIYSILV